MAKLDIPKPIKTVRDDPDGGALAKQAQGVFDAAGTRLIEGMESMEQTAEALATFGNTQDKILTALIDIKDLVEYDGQELKPRVQEYLIELAKSDPKDRPALKQRVVDGIKKFINVVNEAEPIHSKKIDELLEQLRKLSRSLQA